MLQSSLASGFTASTVGSPVGFDPTAESIDVVLTSELAASIRFLAFPRQRYKSEEDSCSHLAVFGVSFLAVFSSVSVHFFVHLFILLRAIISPSFHSDSGS
jgi:hypothetical protein